MTTEEVIIASPDDKPQRSNPYYRGWLTTNAQWYAFDRAFARFGGGGWYTFADMVNYYGLRKYPRDKFTPGARPRLIIVKENLWN